MPIEDESFMMYLHAYSTDPKHDPSVKYKEVKISKRESFEVCKYYYLCMDGGGILLEECAWQDFV